MKDINANPRDGKNYEEAERNSEGNVDGTSFGGSQNEDADQQDDSAYLAPDVESDQAKKTAKDTIDND